MYDVKYDSDIIVIPFKFIYELTYKQKAYEK